MSSSSSSLGARRTVSSAANSAAAARPRSRAPSVAPPPSAAARRAVASSATSSKTKPEQDDQRRKGEGTETNIKVVVRVRGRAPNEPKMTAPSILSTSGPRCSQIDVAMDPVPISSSSNLQPSLVAQEPAFRQKTYHFDQVFGPEADQGMIYQDVLGPILEEVMSGYNCTVFAYGQTGTGKTHTMEGDLTSQMGTYSSEAGIIPRTLYRLFHTLELQQEDYSVKASFIELYNEELRDLLSPDAPVPLTGTTQSGSRDNQQTGLRMYDDAKGRGVVIQGLEEVVMSDAEHGLNLLRSGSHKRQIAATKCNEQSSRSHSVFTMTVHIKEAGSKGEDVLKVGKLNLVDLAGSENIGRSGAENKRAREAGMINQSLLTLGRVINALVEKSSHIPYRESKLTRLLQESLGGRTKTCIIATVSQDKANMEETLSTLDYALRAKSIRNRPEVNTRMNRSALIKEYVLEIERLKGDLLATRLQNGIYMSDESYKTMQDESELHKSQADELRRNSQVAESKLTSLKEQFEQNMQLLVKRDSEIKTVRTDFVEKTAELEAVIAQIAALEKAVEEENALKRAYRESEGRLNAIASSLEQMAKQSSGDVGGLFAKLERKSAVEATNRSLAAECQTSLSAMTAHLEGRVSEFRSSQENFLDDLASNLQSFANKEEQELAEGHKFVKHSLGKLSAMVEAIDQDSNHAHSSLQTLIRQVEAAQGSLKESSEKRIRTIKSSCQSLVSQLVTSNQTQLAQVGSSMQAISSIVTVTRQNASRLLSYHQEQVNAAKEVAKRTAKEEIASLRAQNELLKSLVESERLKGEEMRDQLAQNISSLLVDFTQARDRSLTDSVSKFSSNLKQSKKVMTTFSTDHEKSMDLLARGAAELSDELVAGEQAVQDKRDLGLESIEQAGKMAESEAGALAALDETMEQHAEQVHESCRQIESLMGQARKDAMDQTKVRSDKLESLDKEMSSSHRSVQKSFKSVSEQVQASTTSLGKMIEAHRSTTSTFIMGSASQLSNLRSESRKYLSDRLVEDVSTGETPQKRTWKMPQRWDLVPRNRTAAIESGKQLQLEGDESMDQDAIDAEEMLDQMSEPTHRRETQGRTSAEFLSRSSSTSSIAAKRAAEDALDSSTMRRTKNVRPLQDLPFGHNGIMSASPSEEALDVIKALKTEQMTPDLAGLKQPSLATRGKNKRSAPAPAASLQSSKRSR